MKPFTKARLFLPLVVILALLTAASVFAQDATPQMGDPQAVVESYLMNRDANLLAENVEFADPLGREPIVGRDATAGMEGSMFGEQYGWNLEPWRYFYADTTVVVEFTYADDAANQTAVRSAGAEVAVPLVAIFQVMDGQITSMRTYTDSAFVQTGIGVPGAVGDPGMAVDMSDPYALLDAVTDDPASYQSQTVTVAGPITEVIGAEGQIALVIVERDLLGDDPALIIPESEDVFMNAAWATGEEIQITGTVQQFDMAGLEEQLGRDLDDNLFTGYEDYPVIIASEASLLGGNG